MELRAAAVLQLALLTVLSKMMMPFGFVDVVQNERKCQYLRTGRMLKIRCFDMNLKEVPPYLKSSVEVLDLTFNRIKKLKRSSFQNYKNIKFLLLYENKVQSVEPGTFSHLKSLQEIDLSNNALVTIPLEILQLPSLRNLYVDGNELFNLTPDLLMLQKPIAAPLEYLNIADCGLQNIPDFGALPKLWHINASMNPLTEFSVNALSNMCNLRDMDLTKTEFSDCACQQVNQYLRYIGANTKYVPVCIESFDSSVCPEMYNLTVHSEAFGRCKSEMQRAEERKWLVTGGYCGIGLLALLISTVFFWWCCRRRSKKKKIITKTKMQKATLKHQPLVSPTTALKGHNDRSMLQDSDCV